MTCTCCDAQSFDGEIWPDPDWCPDCHALWTACVRYLSMRGGVDCSIGLLPQVAREIAIRAYAPTPMLAFGPNGFYPSREF